MFINGLSSVVTGPRLLACDGVEPSCSGSPQSWPSFQLQPLLSQAHNRCARWLQTGSNCTFDPALVRQPPLRVT